MQQCSVTSDMFEFSASKSSGLTRRFCQDFWMNNLYLVARGLGSCACIMPLLLMYGRVWATEVIHRGRSKNCCSPTPSAFVRMWLTPPLDCGRPHLAVIHLWRPQENQSFDPTFPCPHASAWDWPHPLVDVHIAQIAHAVDMKCITVTTLLKQLV